LSALRSEQSLVSVENRGSVHHVTLDRIADCAEMRVLSYLYMAVIQSSSGMYRPVHSAVRHVLGSLKVPLLSAAACILRTSVTITVIVIVIIIIIIIIWHYSPLWGFAFSAKSLLSSSIISCFLSVVYFQLFQISHNILLSSLS
jgi:hypothetical protein